MCLERRPTLWNPGILRFLCPWRFNVAQPAQPGIGFMWTGFLPFCLHFGFYVRFFLRLFSRHATVVKDSTNFINLLFVAAYTVGIRQGTYSQPTRLRVEAARRLLATEELSWEKLERPCCGDVEVFAELFVPQGIFLSNTRCPTLGKGLSDRLRCTVWTSTRLRWLKTKELVCMAVGGTNITAGTQKLKPLA